MTLICFKEAPKDTSDFGEISGVEGEGVINPENTDSTSTKTGTKYESNSESCSISSEEKSKCERIPTIFNYKGAENCDEKVQASSSNRCFMMSTSLVVITIICFITGSYLAVRTKTNTDIIRLTGR